MLEYHICENYPANNQTGALILPQGGTSVLNANDLLHVISTIVETEAGPIRCQGSGFLYSRQTEVPSESPRTRETIIGDGDIWLVTNRHVVMPKIQGREIPPTQLTFRFRKRLPTGDFVWEPVSLSVDEIESAASGSTS